MHSVKMYKMYLSELLPTKFVTNHSCFNRRILLETYISHRCYLQIQLCPSLGINIIFLFNKGIKMLSKPEVVVFFSYALLRQLYEVCNLQDASKLYQTWIASDASAINS